MGRYYVNTTSDLIVGSPTSPTLNDPPTGAELRIIPDSQGAMQGGTWDGTTYTAPAGQPSVADGHRRSIFEVYKWWRINGRTEHWVHLRTGNTQQSIPMTATDKWAFHILALCDAAIAGEFPPTAYTAAELAAFLAHAETILLTLGPTWYTVQIAPGGLGTAPAGMYAAMSLADGQAIYTDIVTGLGVLRSVDGAWNPMLSTIAVGFNAEDPKQGRT